MKISDDIINIFMKTIDELKIINNNHIHRKIKEEEYFKVYLDFLNNSIYYSRYKKDNISGK